MFNNGFQTPALKRGSEKKQKTTHSEKETQGLFIVIYKRKPRQAGKTQGEKEKEKRILKRTNSIITSITVNSSK